MLVVLFNSGRIACGLDPFPRHMPIRGIQKLFDKDSNARLQAFSRVLGRILWSICRRLLNLLLLLLFVLSVGLHTCHRLWVVLEFVYGYNVLGLCSSFRQLLG